MAEISSKTTGLTELVEKMQRIAGTDTFTAQVGTESTSGSVSRGQGSVDVSRSAGENVIVLRTQAKAGRQVAFLTEEEHREGQDIWRAAIQRFMASSIAADLDVGARLLAEFIVKTIRNHIERGQGADGPLKPVTAAVQKQKDREVRPGLPPLIRTGQLLRSLIAGVKRG